MALTSVRKEESVTFLVPQSGEKSQIWTVIIYYGQIIKV